jgi:hypothetical protein
MAGYRAGVAVALILSGDVAVFAVSAYGVYVFLH